jgi:hypothetical protein
VGESWSEGPCSITSGKFCNDTWYSIMFMHDLLQKEPELSELDKTLSKYRAQIDWWSKSLSSEWLKKDVIWIKRFSNKRTAEKKWCDTFFQIEAATQSFHTKKTNPVLLKRCEVVLINSRHLRSVPSRNIQLETCSAPIIRFEILTMICIQNGNTCSKCKSMHIVN